MHLLNEGLGTLVLPTDLTQKLTLDGITKAYPVYRVRIDQLYYNDQNDRIATWISQHVNEHGADFVERMDRASYNTLIEQFIIQSNPTAIDKTQLNIDLVGQRSPGVILADGRVIDGNRRFTCLRRLAAKDERFQWFETVILDSSLETSRKQIKMLELALQHGEEKKVDYNPIDRLVGVYHDIVETKLLSVEEYAFSTNETVAEVNKRIALAELMVDFLSFIDMPGQYHIAREYQLVSALTDLQDLLKKFSTPEEKEEMKKIVFTNIMMKTIGDSRKYVRNLNSMMNNGLLPAYIKEQKRIGTEIQARREESQPTTKASLDAFVDGNEDLTDGLQLSMDRSLLKAKRTETHNKPSQIVSKSITMLKDVDTRIFEKLTTHEKDNLRRQVDRLSTMIGTIDSMITDEAAKPPEAPQEEQPPAVQAGYRIAPFAYEQPMLRCGDLGRPFASLLQTLHFDVLPAQHGLQKTASFRLFFVNETHQPISDIQEVEAVVGASLSIGFTLFSSSSQQKKVYLAVQAKQDPPDALQFLLPFDMNILFTTDIDF